MATGHIRQRNSKDGKVSYQVIVEGNADPVTGKRDRHYETVNGTKKQAMARMRDMIRELEGGSLARQSPMKLEAWLNRYITDYKPNIEATTRAGYEEKIRNCVLPEIGRIPVSALNANTIQKWVNGLDSQGMSPKTIRNAYNIVHAALKKAKVIGMIPSDPCEGVELPKLERYEAHVYDTETIRRAIETARGTDMFLPVVLLTNVGLRRGELCALKWEHIDFEGQVIRVRENTVLANGEIITKKPKTASGIRNIPVGKEVMEALREAKQRYFENRATLGAGFRDDGYVFCKANGEQYRPDSITQKWERFVREKGLPPIRLHDLRHPYVKTATTLF